MDRTRRTWIATLALAVGALTLVGCSNDNLKVENDELYMQNEQLQAQLDAERARAEAAESEREQLMQQVADLREQLTSRPQPGRTGFEGIEGVSVEQGARGEIAVRVPGDVLFASGKADLRAGAKQTLDQIAGVLRNDYAGNTIRVEGYSDSDPIRKSKWKDNLELSTQRAMAVHRYLQEKGIGEDRMYAAGFGATNFVAPNNTAQGKAQNRRVEIVVVTN